MKKTLLFFTFLLTALYATAQQPKITRHVGDVPGGYNYWLVEPAETTNPKPVIIFLHGASLRGNNLDQVKRYGTLDAVIKGREIDAYVIAPQLPGSHWKPEKVKEILDYVEERHNIDENRVYVVGMSLGGYGTLDFAATYPDIVAAAVGMCGGATVKDLSGLNELPLWIIHGTGDNAVSVTQSDKVVSAIRQVDPKAPRLIYDRVPGMNHSRPARAFYLPELYEWLFKHSLQDDGRKVHKAIKIEEPVLQRAYQGINFKKK